MCSSLIIDFCNYINNSSADKQEELYCSMENYFKRLDVDINEYIERNN